MKLKYTQAYYRALLPSFIYWQNNNDSYNAGIIIINKTTGVNLEVVPMAKYETIHHQDIDDDDKL